MFFGNKIEIVKVESGKIRNSQFWDYFFYLESDFNLYSFFARSKTALSRNKNYKSGKWGNLPLSTFLGLWKFVDFVKFFYTKKIEKQFSKLISNNSFNNIKFSEVLNKFFPENNYKLTEF